MIGVRSSFLVERELFSRRLRKLSRSRCFRIFFWRVKYFWSIWCFFFVIKEEYLGRGLSGGDSWSIGCVFWFSLNFFNFRGKLLDMV